MSDFVLFSFTEPELSTFIRQVLDEYRSAGSTPRAIAFAVSLANIHRTLREAKMKAIMGKAAPAQKINFVAEPNEILKGV